jgi:hypothetical protein
LAHFDEQTFTATFNRIYPSASTLAAPSPKLWSVGDLPLEGGRRIGITGIYLMGNLYHVLPSGFVHLQKSIALVTAIL